jgi:two-component system chemotaxis response regulator CheY
MTSDTPTRARVLVVDDAATVRMYHNSLLDGAGFEVSEAANGLEAVEAALGPIYGLNDRHCQNSQIFL